MGKTAQNNVKYVIDAKLESTGIIEKPDVVGAIFGQTEGLLGEELDLRELQKRGRIGRLDIDVKTKDGSSEAEIKIPSSLDATDTALIAASLETIERVGPTNAEITVKGIRDERMSKRDYIVKRAKQLLKDVNSQSPDHNRITEEVKQEVRKQEVTDYKGFSAGPDVATSEEIILVEGRADLMNLLRNGVKNALAIGGTSVPPKLEEIGEEKDLTAFLDGDRGGNLILEELKEKAKPRYVARAPENKEVEELSGKEIHSALRDKEPVKYVDTGEVEEKDNEEELEMLQEALKELVGTRAVHALDEDFEVVEKLPIDRIDHLDTECEAVAFDGEITPERVEKAEELGASYVAGMERSGRATSSRVELVTRKQKAEA